MKYMIGKKLGTTQLFDEDGIVVPVTVIGMEPQIVVQKKTAETDGYNAIQVASGAVKEKRANRPMKSHLDKVGVDYRRQLREFRTDDVDSCNVGDEIKVDIFATGDKVDVTGTSKGKGTAGAIRRHHFGRGHETHGSKSRRTPGGMGTASHPDKAWKGHRMAGKMDNEGVTVQNSEVARADVETGILLVKGVIPGSKKGPVVVKETVKNVEQSSEGGTEYA